MNKYLQMFKMQLEECLSYRFNFLSTGIYLILPLLSHLCIWIAMFKAGINPKQMGGYTLPMIITYTILGHYVDKHTNEVLLQLKISSEIRNGLISRYLVQPMNPYLSDFSNHLANTFITMLTITPVYAVLIFIYRNEFIFEENALYIVLMVINFLLAVVIGYLLNHIIGAITFWLKDIMSIYVFTQSTFLFLSGGYLPIDLLPTPVYEFLMITPFPYLLYFPVSIFVKQYPIDFIIKHMCIAGIWIAVLGVVSNFVYNAGLKHYEASGI